MLKLRYIVLALLIVSLTPYLSHALEKKKGFHRPKMQPTAVEPNVNPQAVAFSETDFPPGPTVPPMGRGYDSFTGQVKFTSCVEPVRSDSHPFVYLPHNEDTSGTPQDAYLLLENIESTESLRSALNLSLAATFKLGLFASGSLSYNYFAGSNFSRYSNLFSVKVVVTNQTQDMTPDLQLTAAAKRAWRRGPLAFYNLCGTDFVAGTVTGGEFQALIRITTQSEEEQKSIGGTLSTSVGIFGTADIRYQQNMQRLATLKNINISVVSRAPSDQLPNLDIPSLTQYALAFPKKVDPTSGGHPYVYQIHTGSYRGLLPDYDISVDQWRALSKLADILGRLYGRKAGLLYMRANPQSFPQMGLKQLQSEIRIVEGAIQTIQYVGEDCANDKTKCKFANYPIIPDLPSRTTWNNFAPNAAKNPNEITLTTTQPGDDRMIQFAGSWSAWDYGDNWYAPNWNTRVKLIDRETGQVIREFSPGANIPFEVPGNTIVTFQFLDSIYTDNRINPNDPLRWILYERYVPLNSADFPSRPPR